MNGKLKYRVVYLSIFLIFIPFILITSIYPVMRMGMFAEPVDGDKIVTTYTLLGTEQQIVTTRADSLFTDNTKVNPYPLHYVHTHIPDHTINYLIRNHIYRNEVPLLFSKLFDNPNLSNYERLDILETKIQNGEVISKEIIYGQDQIFF